MNLLELFKNADDMLAFAAGETIFSEGDPGDTLYVVVEGVVEMKYGGRVLEEVEPGGIFGELGIIDDSPRSASAVARTDCKLVGLTVKRFEFLVQETPFFATEVMRVMANRLRRETQ